MNRRGFLGSLTALAVAPFVPMPRTVNWHPEVVTPHDPWHAMIVKPSVQWHDGVPFEWDSGDHD